MRAGSRSAASVQASHAATAAAAAAIGRADELRCLSVPTFQRLMEYFVIWRRPRVFPSYFLFLHGEALAAAAEGLNKPAKNN